MGMVRVTKVLPTLKKLIEEAIKKANDSLDTRQKQLECPTTSASGSGVSYCQSQETEIQKANEQLKTLESNNPNDSKKQIAEQNAKIKKAEASKNDCAKTHYLPEEERDKGLDEVRQQREIVKKLTEFKDTLTNNNDILTHLCDGLEKFLGFNSDSKGYDGTGIVYSDLDRLCDAVMGFLSGVLGAVKDDEAVKTYDKSDENIEKVINKLNNNIGSGRAGLVESVAAVKGWLEGYGREVKEKIKHVTAPLRNMQEFVIIDIETKILEMEHKDYEENIGKLSTWAHDLSGLTEKTQDSLNALSNIDKHFNNVLYQHVNSIHQAAHSFRENGISDVNNLKAVCSNVSVQLRNVTAAVISYADCEGEKCITDLKEVFTRQIKTPIENIKIRLNNLNVQLDDWIMKAQLVVNSTISQCTGIIKIVQNNDHGRIKSAERNNVEKAATELKQKADKLRILVIEAKSEVQRLVKSAIIAVNTMNEALKRNVQSLKDEITKKVQGIKNKIGELGNQYAEASDRNSIKGIFEYINKQVVSIKSGVGYKGNENSGIYKHWTDLKPEIDQLIRDLAGTDQDDDDDRNGYLHDIDEGVGRYALQFKMQFEKAIKTIVTAMMEGGEEENKIRGFIINASGGAGSTEKIRAVKTAMTNQILKLSGAANIPNAEPDDAKKTLESIVTYLNDYAEQIQMKLNILSAFILSVEKDDALTTLNHKVSLTTGDKNLQSAVRNVLATVKKIIEGAKDDVSQFIKDSSIGKLNQAIEKVENMRKTFKYEGVTAALSDVLLFIEKLHDSLSTTTGKVSSKLKSGTHYAAEVDEAIDQVTTRLEQQIPSEGNKVDLSKENALGDYTLHVDQKYRSLQALEVGTVVSYEAGALPGKIMDIQGQVNGDDVLGKVSDENDTTNIPSMGHDKVYRNTFDLLLQQIESNMQTFCEAVEGLVKTDAGTVKDVIPNKSRGVQNLLEDLQTMIHSDTLYGTQIHLREMYKEINTNIIGDARSYNSDTVPSNLTQIMVFANMFNSTAIPNRINECISDITAKVKYEVTEKIKTLKKSALSQFVTRKTAELEELKKFVHYQKNIISKTIFTNQTTGLKGLMNTIGSNLQSYIDPLRYPSVKDLSKHLDFYFNPLFTHISTEASPSSQLVAGLQARTYDLLTHLHDNNRTFTFDSGFRSRLHSLTSALSTFDPAAFANPHHPQLLDALKAGMRGLVGEMEKAYVNRYDGHPKMEWEKDVPTKELTPTLSAALGCY
ncbi:hypothetical protein, conserved [Babesia bigemina]|uniref:Uncharacterized protein n=1 Tax=Babesia bigemina TaxID=5866 RepID=A0A061BLS4_BABBI|nr:hypothetical protein, conserved [Babesia bigemina]CDR71826.1 hypothetical protein, conserved [Babesia bigemina]|eukprot:XP_012770769.1 hypothetical protein, conserved [Babesia bigemina]